MSLYCLISLLELWFGFLETQMGLVVFISEQADWFIRFSVFCFLVVGYEKTERL